MDRVNVRRKESSVSVDIPIGTSIPQINVCLGSHPTVKYKIHCSSNDGKSTTFTEVWKYISGELKEYEKIRDIDNQVIRIERHYDSNPPRKPGKYIDVFTWDDTDKRFERKTYFRRKWLFFWGKIVSHDGPIL